MRSIAQATMRQWLLTALLTAVVGAAILHQNELHFSALKPHESNLPAGFVYLDEIDSTIIQEVRYAGYHNFVGRPIRGYLAPKCILTKAAAIQLSQVQSLIVSKYNLSLKVYDCYRPQMAVDHFADWAANVSDLTMRDEFYQTIHNKSDLFALGYIAYKSGHSRGSTVDLTIVPIPVPPQPEYRPGDPLVSCVAPLPMRFADNSIDMGTGFDCFDTLAHTLSPNVTIKQAENRSILYKSMSIFGFKSLPEEWWHFTLIGEPFPSTYFNFSVA